MTYKPKPKIWTGYLDGYLKTNFNEAKEVIKKDWDMVIVVDGYEGTGKSTLAQQLAKFCDPDFDLSRICFSASEFIEAINSSQKYQAVVFDEAYGSMMSRAAISEINRTLVKMMAEIRQKNLFIFIVLPSFFELDKYIAIHRSRSLIHCYTSKKWVRGFFRFYNQDQKRRMYVLGKKEYDYHKGKMSFFGRFTGGYVVDEDAYKKKKNDALTAYEKNRPEGVREKKYKEQRDSVIAYVKEKFGLKDKELSETTGMTQRNINRASHSVEIPKDMGFSLHSRFGLSLDIPDSPKNNDNKRDLTK